MDKYLQFDHFELSEDPSFIRWAKGSPARDEHDWDNWLLNHPDRAEIASKAKTIVLAMKFVKDVPTAKTEEKVWNNISTDITKNKSSSQIEKPNRRQIFKLLPYAAVAAVALLLFYINISSDYDTSFDTPYAKIENITLPDGSEVILNADSKLKYDAKSWNNKRIVSLEGEAFFEVEKGSQFTVKTKNGRVQVLGTSFNVFDRGNQFNVQCESGKVSVVSREKETILMPQQSVSVVGRNHVFKDNMTENERRSTWKNGIYVYKSTPVSDVISEMERQLDIKISIEKSLRNKQYTGSFNKSNLETALSEVFYPMGLKFEVNGNNVVVTK